MPLSTGPLAAVRAACSSGAAIAERAPRSPRDHEHGVDAEQTCYLPDPARGQEGGPNGRRPRKQAGEYKQGPADPEPGGQVNSGRDAERGGIASSCPERAGAEHVEA